MAELRGDDDLALEGFQRLADQALVGEGAVGLGRVEEGDAALDRLAEQRDHLVPVRHHAAVVVQSHAAEANGRNLQAAAAKHTLLHRRLSGSKP